jgi:hypothetical protein
MAAPKCSTIPTFPDPTEHAASRIEALDGDLRLLQEMLPSFTPQCGLIGTASPTVRHWSRR